MIVGVRNLMRLGVVAGLFVLVLTAAPVAAQGIPDEFTNLDVLPDDISRRELIGVMRGFAGGLGVRCTHCHTVSDNFDSPDDDFASDEKPAKEKARAMMRMVLAINGDHINRLADREEHELEVSCVTCHAGRSLPATLDQEMTWAAEEGGYAALEVRYNELRGRYFGRGSYDFGPRPLERVAQALARDDSDAAMAVVDLNLQHHPESLTSWMLKGQIHAFEDRVEQAIEAFERAQELAPDSEQVAEALARVRDGGA
jgi:hypothetical protein